MHLFHALEWLIVAVLYPLTIYKTTTRYLGMVCKESIGHLNVPEGCHY